METRNKQSSLDALFEPLIWQWFRQEYGEPTSIQQLVWPRVAIGEHILVTAPTGSGKTLSAFLWALNCLIRGTYGLEQTSVLYVSPLKALNNDIQRNLLKPLYSLSRLYESQSRYFPNLRVLTRSGDTSQSERRKMLHHPPEILITTPESLNLLLSSQGGRSILTHISTVIVDEIHSLVDSKRGVHCISAIDRLVLLSGEFQRIALSATVRPLDMVAEYIGGYRFEGTTYVKRPVSIIKSSDPKKYNISICFADNTTEKSIWDFIIDEILSMINNNRSTLVFTNTRRLCERITNKINDRAGETVAYSHHGSLSREVRKVVETKLKQGELRAIIATNSLELGIDIGHLDQVILVQSPSSISSAIQRIGRACHQVGRASSGILFPTHGQDILESTVLVQNILSQNIEAVKPVICPLDVLAQVFVSMIGTEDWDIDDLFSFIVTSYPFHTLSRKQFELVLDMLAGRYSDSRLRELNPKVSIDRIDNRVSIKKGALLDLYLSGGMIPDRGYFNLRHQHTHALLGELDEEFVWEARIGQNFTLGTQNWKIERITDNDVFVSSGDPKKLASPFWKGEGLHRDYHYSERIGTFLEFINEKFDTTDLLNTLIECHHLNHNAAEELILYLKKQREITGCDLPHRHHLVIEQVSTSQQHNYGNQVILHTFWGGRLNYPFGIALAAAWEKKFHYQLEMFIANDCIVLQLPHPIPGEELLSLVTPGNLEQLLREKLELSGFFGARFRENAGRALLLGRFKKGQRTPLWLNRIRSKKLMNAILRYDDFPILIETWRTCLHDEFELDNLRMLLGELTRDEITWSECKTSEFSPMAQSVIWRQTNYYMYLDDASTAANVSQLPQTIFQEIIHSSQLRPKISKSSIHLFQQKRQRIFPGYSPDNSRDLLDHIKERIFIPLQEWEELTRAIQRDHNIDPWLLIESVLNKIVRITSVDSNESLIVALENLDDVIALIDIKVEMIEINQLNGGSINFHFQTNSNSEETNERTIGINLLSEWLSFYGPLPSSQISILSLIPLSRVEEILIVLLENNQIISDKLIIEDETLVYCDIDNYEILLRMLRSESRPHFEPKEIEWLPFFLATIQHLTEPVESADEFYERLEHILYYKLPCRLWESDIFPARCINYQEAWLDEILHQSELLWLGTSSNNILFCYDTDRDLLEDDSAKNLENDRTNSDIPSNEIIPADVLKLFPDDRARYDFLALLKLSGWSSTMLYDLIWQAVWSGKLTNDSFVPVRKGISSNFALPNMRKDKKSRSQQRRFSKRHGFSRWKQTLSVSGYWFRINEPTIINDLLEEEERNKDRVRVLLDRYGILFRELLLRELPQFRWSVLLKSIRLMELAGEVLAGYFFKGIPGLQFMSPKAFRLFQRELTNQTIFWLNATDPASLCGIQLEHFKTALPNRLAHNHITYRGKDIVFISEHHGKKLTFNIPLTDPDINQFLVPLRNLLTRTTHPLRKIKVHFINGEKASESDYIDVLKMNFDVSSEVDTLVLRTKFN